MRYLSVHTVINHHRASNNEYKSNVLRWVHLCFSRWEQPHTRNDCKRFFQINQLSSNSLLLATRLDQYNSEWWNIWTQQLDACGYFHHVQQRVGSTWSPVSKCIFYGPLITQANHFSIVSRGTMTPLMACILARVLGSTLVTVRWIWMTEPQWEWVPTPPFPLDNPQEKGSAFRVRYA